MKKIINAVYGNELNWFGCLNKRQKRKAIYFAVSLTLFFFAACTDSVALQVVSGLNALCAMTFMANVPTDKLDA